MLTKLESNSKKSCVREVKLTDIQIVMTSLTVWGEGMS